MQASRQEAAASIIDQFPDEAAPGTDEVADRLRVLVEEYKVPEDEAHRAVRNHFMDAAGLSIEDLDAQGAPDDREPTALATVDAADVWLSVTAKVVELWEPTSEKIAQVGLLGDETGTLKFTAWSTSDLAELVEDQVYRFDNIVTDEYQGRYSVNLNSATEITPVDEDIEVGSTPVAMDGAVVAVQTGSGLIKRCSADDCSRVLQSGRCTEHGEVDGVFDLRIKGVLDDGTTVTRVIFDQAATEAVADMTLEDATELAMDALDTSVVADSIADTVRGRYYRVEGPVVGEFLLVDDHEPLVDHREPSTVVAALSDAVEAEG